MAVSDTESILYYGPSQTIDVKLKPGDKFAVDGPMAKTIKEGKIYSSIVPKELYGVPFKTITYPIKDLNGNAIGAFATTISIKNNLAKVEEAAEGMFSSLQQTNASIEGIGAGSQKPDILDE